MRHHVFALLALFACANASAADLIKCTAPDGKVAFQDRPCEGKAKGEQVIVQANTIAPTDTTETSKKLEAVNKRLAARTKADDDYRERVAAQNARHDLECRRYAEEIVRQRAWLSASSPAVRQSASNEIAIQRARLIDFGC
jgi:hypothetical protein